MASLNLFRHFSCTGSLCFSSRVRACLTSNVEVFNEISTKNQPTFAEIYQGNLDKNQRIGLTREHNQKIIEYFDSKPSLKDLKNIIPASYFLKSKSTDKSRMLLVDRNVARDILNALQPQFENYNGHIVEVNAGAGILTEELLKAEIQKLRIYEPDAVFCNHILKLIKQYNSNARLFIANLLALGTLAKLDRLDNDGRTEALLGGLPTLCWEDEPVVKLIAALPNERFVLHIMFSITLGSGLCKYGRPELFLILPPDSYMKLKSKPEEVKYYRSSSVTFQIFFDHEALLKVPENVFVPWSISSKSKKRKIQGQDEILEELCLVKMTPKQDLLQNISPSLLKPFWFFVKSLMHKKSSSLIERMENWIPGSGVRLISKGYTIFTTCGSLTPDEYLKIFLEFSSWPEFQSCSFLPSMEGLLSKLLQSIDVDEDVSEEKLFKLLNKESNVSEDDDAIDDGANVGDGEESISVNDKKS